MERESESERGSERERERERQRESERERERERERARERNTSLKLGSFTIPLEALMRHGTWLLPTRDEDSHCNFCLFVRLRRCLSSFRMPV